MNNSSKSNRTINTFFLAHEHWKMAKSLKSLTVTSMFPPKMSKLSKFMQAPYLFSVQESDNKQHIGKKKQVQIWLSTSMS